MSYGMEWCRTFWNTMRFMQAVYTRLDKSGELKVDHGWNGGRDEDDPGDDENSATIYIECKPATAKQEQMYLGIFFSIDPDGPENDYPLWLIPWRDDPALRARLQQAFPGNVVRDGDEVTIGLPLEIPVDAKEGDIVGLGNSLADKVIAVLVPA